MRAVRLLDRLQLVARQHEPPAAAAVPPHPVDLGADPPRPRGVHVETLGNTRPDALRPDVGRDVPAPATAGEEPRAGTALLVLVRHACGRAVKGLDPIEVARVSRRARMRM